MVAASGFTPEVHLWAVQFGKSATSSPFQQVRSVLYSPFVFNTCSCFDVFKVTVRVCTYFYVGVPVNIFVIGRICSRLRRLDLCV